MKKIILFSLSILTGVLIAQQESCSRAPSSLTPAIDSEQKVTDFLDPEIDYLARIIKACHMRSRSIEAEVWALEMSRQRVSEELEKIENKLEDYDQFFNQLFVQHCPGGSFSCEALQQKLHEF